MCSRSYYLIDTESVLSHFPGWQPLVRDTDSSGLAADEPQPDNDAFGSSADISELLSRARALSGDYFETLATELDKIAQGLAVAQAPEAPELERMVSELLYIGRNFKLTKVG